MIGYKNNKNRRKLNVTSWIVQENSQTFMADFYFDEYAKLHPNETDWWLIFKKHIKFMEVGDTVYIWKAKSEPPKWKTPEYYQWKDSIGKNEKICGIIAIGEVVSLPEPFFETQEEADKFKKYRVVDKYSFTSSDYIFKCVYGGPKNIRVRNPLLEGTIWNHLGKSSDTEFGKFANRRRGIRSVKLEPMEADIIKSLLA
jgi:hypothetical protein